MAERKPIQILHDAMMTHVAVMDEELKKPARTRHIMSPEMWKLRSSTYMENWPKRLMNLSIPSVGIVLEERQARMFGSMMMELGAGFDERDFTDEDVKAYQPVLESRLDVVKIWPEGGFVRLGSRSPKDTMAWGMGPEDSPEGMVKTGAQALWRLLGCSERVYEDTQAYLAMVGYVPIFLRQWINMPEWTEFRCWWRNRKLIAISQYYYRNVYDELVVDSDKVQYEIERFAREEFDEAIHLDNVIFDVFIQNGKARLLEINPYWNMTDPCLFSWQEIDSISDDPNEVEFRILRTNEDLLNFKLKKR